MSQAKISAFERLFDRAIALVIIAIGAVVAGGVAIVGG